MSSSMKQRGSSVTTQHSHNEPTVSCMAICAQHIHETDIWAEDNFT